jgi:hypothetical protein
VNLFKTRAQALQMKRRFNNKKRRQVMNALPGQHPQTLSPGPLKVALAGVRPEPALRWSHRGHAQPAHVFILFCRRGLIL